MLTFVIDQTITIHSRDGKEKFAVVTCPVKQCSIRYTAGEICRYEVLVYWLEKRAAEIKRSSTHFN